MQECISDTKCMD